MKKAYVISLATAASLSYAAGLATDFDARAAQPQTKTIEVEFELGPTAQATVESFLQAQACPKVDAKLELTGDDVCDVTSDLAYACMYWNDIDHAGKVNLRAEFPIAGTYTPRALQ